MEKRVKFLKGIDFLRVIAIVGIVLYHIWPHSVPGGFIGVCLFFMISGYLLFLTSDADYKNGEMNALLYYKKRILRIYPNLFFMIMCVIAYLTLFQRGQLIGIRDEVVSILGGYNNWWQIGQNASYFTKIANNSPFTHLWFLAVEIQLYLIWPLVFKIYLWLCKKSSKDKALFFFLVLALISAILMSVFYSEDNLTRVYYGTDTRAFSLFLGAFFGAIGEKYAGEKKRIKMSHLILFLMCIISVLWMYFHLEGESVILYQGGMAVTCLVFGLMLLLVTKTRIGELKLVSWKPIQMISEKSYLIYLWHYPLIFLINSWR